MEILCIGQCAYDITFPIKGEISENHKYRIKELYECIGAPAANSAYLCAKWGGNVGIISRVGKDIYGDKVLNVLSNEGVNTDFIVIDDKFNTPLSCIISNIENGDRTIFNCPGKLNDINFLFPKKEPKVILVDGHELEASKIALNKYKNSISIIDAGTFNENTKILSSLVDYLICSEDFARQFTGIEIDINDIENLENIFRKLEEINNKNIVITLGESGLVYKENNKINILKAYPSKAVDTTGAGDIFHGTFAYCMSKNYNKLEALKISSITSAISVGKFGGQSSIPSKKMVNEYIFKFERGLKLI